MLPNMLEFNFHIYQCFYAILGFSHVTLEVRFGQGIKK